MENLFQSVGGLLQRPRPGRWLLLVLALALTGLGHTAAWAQAPTLTSLNPTSGPVGTVVTLTGTNFTGANQVAFNATVVSGFLVSGSTATPTTVTATTITVPVPAGTVPGTGNVVVRTAAGWSNAISFTVTQRPTVTTNTNMAITATSTTAAGVGGSAGDNGSAITDRGVVYLVNTSTTPTLANATVVHIGTGQGAFTTTLTGLTPSTQYIVRAFAINAAGTTYGTSEFFTTAAPGPTLTSAVPASGVPGSTITLNGTRLFGTNAIVFAGTANNVVSSGFTVNPAGTQITGIVVPSGAVTGNVSVNAMGGGFPPTFSSSNGIPFTVGAATTAPDVTTAIPLAITATTATLGGTVNATGGVPVTERGVVYVLGNGIPTTADTKVAMALGSGTGSYAQTVTGLTPNSTYTVRAYATNSTGTGYGANERFANPALTAVTWTGATSTAWVTASNWSPAVVPTASISATIVPTSSPAFQPTVTSTQVCNNLIVQANATLTLAVAAELTTSRTVTLAASSALVQQATSELYIGGDLTNNGATLTLDPTSEVGFGLGPTNHTINGSTGLTLQILTVGERVIGGVVDLLHLAVPVRVARKLELANGAQVDNTTGSLTLLSTPAATALIVQDATSSVTSPATIQRYLNTTNAGLGYRHYSSPVVRNSLNDLATATFTPVFDAAYNRRATAHPAAGFPTVFGYDQGRLATAASPYTGFDKGWFSPDARGSVPNFQPGQGYAVNLRGTELVDFVGVPLTGDQGLNLRRAAGSTGGEGLHLVGNPYPAPIDWSLVVPGDRPNLDAAFYVFVSSSQYGGSYRTAVNGVGASNYIGMGQGFFVRVSPGQTSGTLTFKDTHRLTDETLNVPVRRGAADVRPLVQLTLAGAGASDDVYVYAQAGATPGTDAEFDAAKLPNPTGLNLASLTATGEALAIDGRAGFGTATIIPLQVAVPAAGSYTFTAASLAHLAGTRAELVDNLTGTRTALVVGAAYRFTMSTTTAPGRFFLNLAPAAAPLASAAATALAAQVLTYPNPTTGRLTVVRPVGAAATAVLLNSLGQTVRTLQLPTAETALDLRGLATGVYTLRLTLDGQPVSKRVVLE